MSGFRTWQPGEVITASNINDYLQNQAVMVFADAATRTSTISVPLEGMLSWLEDENEYFYYDGSAWENLIVPITGGTAGQAYVSNGASEAGFQDVKAEFIATTVTNKSSAYTVVLGDANTTLNFTAAAVITFPDVLTSIGDRVDIIANTTSTVEIIAGSGVTSWAGAGSEGTSVEFYIDTPYAAASVIKTAANQYRVIGRVSA